MASGSDSLICAPSHQVETKAAAKTSSCKYLILGVATTPIAFLYGNIPGYRSMPRPGSGTDIAAATATKSVYESFGPSQCSEGFSSGACSQAYLAWIKKKSREGSAVVRGDAVCLRPTSDTAIDRVCSRSPFTSINVSRLPLALTSAACQRMVMQNTTTSSWSGASKAPVSD